MIKEYYVMYGPDDSHLTNCKFFKLLRDAKAFSQNKKHFKLYRRVSKNGFDLNPIDTLLSENGDNFKIKKQNETMEERYRKSIEKVNKNK